MSQSPPDQDVEPAAPSPDNNEHEPQADGDKTEMSVPDEHGEGAGYDFEVKEQDRWLPIANVARIMKTALPENAKIAKEAKECMQECVSEFISFITSEASEKCQQEKRKTVNGEDILFAMTSLGFENYGEALKIYLARYRENLIARGEHPKTGAAGSANSATEPAFESAEHATTNSAMDTVAEGATDFAYAVGHGSGDY